jgi:NAD(P)-dependent dehydrogenase (short-subunit alcohol dehydrogenase family)
MTAGRSTTSRPLAGVVSGMLGRTFITRLLSAGAVLTLMWGGSRQERDAGTAEVRPTRPGRVGDRCRPGTGTGDRAGAGGGRRGRRPRAPRRGRGRRRRRGDRGPRPPRAAAADVAPAVDAAAGHFGRLDILVNNAGIAPGNPAEDVLEEDLDATLAVNLKGTFLASQAAGRIMIRQGSGKIINIGSQAGAVALPGESVYCMTKAAIAHLTRCLAVEWGRHGITVNAVAPTFIRTPGTEPALSDPEFRADVIERIAALHRIGEPIEVAGVVVFLASPAASLITGETILVDGGWTAR